MYMKRKLSKRKIDSIISALCFHITYLEDDGDSAELKIAQQALSWAYQQQTKRYDQQ